MVWLSSIKAGRDEWKKAALFPLVPREVVFDLPLASIDQARNYLIFVEQPAPIPIYLLSKSGCSFTHS